MNKQFDFRALLLKIQDLLSDKDRERLHFLLGEDIPRDLRDDTSLGGALRVLQSLFDKAFINDQDCDYLIDAFIKICCQDAAKRLQGSFFLLYTRQSHFAFQNISEIKNKAINKVSHYRIFFGKTMKKTRVLHLVCISI